MFIATPIIQYPGCFPAFGQKKKPQSAKNYGHTFCCYIYLSITDLGVFGGGSGCRGSFNFRKRSFCVMGDLLQHIFCGNSLLIEGNRRAGFNGTKDAPLDDPGSLSILFLKHAASDGPIGSVCTCLDGLLSMPSRPLHFNQVCLL